MKKYALQHLNVFKATPTSHFHLQSTVTPRQNATLTTTHELLQNDETNGNTAAVSRCCRLCEQRPSNQGDLDSSVTREVGRVYYIGVNLLLF
jgi:hypothetical protein